MTVQLTTNSQLFLGSGNTGPFTWTWRFLSNSHIVVKKTSGGVETTLVEGVGYTLAGAGGYQGGTLIATDVLAVGESLLVYRNTTATQDVDLRNQGDFFPESYEDALDALTMMIQDGVLTFTTALALLAARATSLESRVTDIETGGYTFTINQASGSLGAMYEVPTSGGDVVVNLPASGTVGVMKDGTDAYIVTFATTAGGQTIKDYVSLETDGAFVWLTLFGSQWRVTG